MMSKMKSSNVEFDIDDKIYDQQISTGKEIIYSNYICSIPGEEKRWVILSAQMQSGKTGTYLFTAFEMLVEGLVENVVIFSGNRETELREQVLQDLEDFVFTYSLYLSSVVDWSERERMRKSREARSKIRVVWGTGLKNEPTFPMRQTLFVFDESHYAQNKGMQVDKFLTKIGISAIGEGLDQSKNFVLSVSATPMSEVSDKVHCEQTKGIVYLEPGPTYFGVAEMIETRNIVGFNVADWVETLETALTTVSRSSIGFKYGLIRLTKAGKGRKGTARRGGTEDEDEYDLEAVTQARQIATRCGWGCLFCDSDQEQAEALKINIIDLITAPTERHILVILKSKCRMGQVVPKQHIAFGMETSKNPNTDVILQSLLGRFCGHHQFRNIIVYVPNKVVESGELEKYIAMCRGFSERRTIEIIPSKAKNIVSGFPVQRSLLNTIIQIQVTGLDFDLIGIDNNVLKDSVIAAVRDNNRMAGTSVINYNSEEQYREIQEKIDNTDYGLFYVRVVKRGGTYHKAGVPAKLHSAISERKPISLGSSVGIDAAGTKIVIYKFGEDYSEFGFKKNDVFVDMRIATGAPMSSYSEELKKRIPITTKREIFRHTMETGREVAMNGAMMLGLNVETHRNVTMMRRCLTQLIQLSLQEHGDEDDRVIIYPRRINSVINEAGESAGIWMTQEVYDAVKPGGQVFNELREEFGIDLVLKMRKNDNFKTGLDTYIGKIKFLEISW
jgi:hypothetical protein